MGKKKKFARFIRWIKSDLPDENKSVLLLGVTKIPSPSLARARPHTLHLDHHLAAKSQTLDSQPFPRPRPIISKSRSNDSLIDSDIIENPNFLDNLNGKFVHFRKNGGQKRNFIEKFGLKSNEKYSKRVSFEDSKFGFCTELPFEYYHPKGQETRVVESKNNTESLKSDSRIPGLHIDTRFSDTCVRNSRCDSYSPESRIPEFRKPVLETDDAKAPEGIMDKSVDSIGSCSLDVDASSTDFSDSSVESSNCTLRSVGIPTPIKDKSLPTFQLETQTDVETKKPSYLNLACTVNGYSNITNYDSKLRENFRIPRSREVSPIRPQEYHVTDSLTHNTERYLTPNYNKNILSSPSKMTESKSHTVLQSNYSYTSTSRTSFMSKETRNFAKSMLYEDTVDSCHNGRLNGKFSSYETSKVSHSSYTNVNGQEKHFSETIENHYTNGNQSSPDSRKSFIQQRVERLYGPAALAQGFFISKRSKSRISESENENTLDIKPKDRDSESENSIKQSSSSPSLPVLRHLRPEFRAQLPILSPKRENSIQKSTTVPSSLTSVTNGVDKKIVNGSKSVENIENKENIQVIKKEPEVKKVIKIIEEIPAAPQVILPIPKELNGSELIDTKEINGDITKVCEVKDGHYFLKILKNETDRLIKLAEGVEKQMERKKTELPDEILGYLRSASGKARLLVTQKMQQFEGLCHKNINQIPGEPFPTTAEDLQGFWDMVMLQVTQVDQLFAEIDSLRANNWIIPEKPKPDAVEKPKKIVKKIVSAKAEAERKQREAARKKMIEERRKAMREKQQQEKHNGEKGIEIFVPESS